MLTPSLLKKLHTFIQTGGCAGMICSECPFNIMSGSSIYPYICGKVLYSINREEVHTVINTFIAVNMIKELLGEL